MRRTLSNADELALGTRALQGDLAARHELVDSCIGLAYSLARRRGWQNYSGIEVEDLEQEALAALCGCAQRFDPVRHPNVRFSTFAGTCIIGRLCSYCAANRRRELTNFDMREFVDPASMQPMEERDAEAIWTALEELGREELDLLDLHYGLNGGPRLTLGEIGDRLSVSKQRVHQRIAASVAKLGDALRKSA